MMRPDYRVDQRVRTALPCKHSRAVTDPRREARVATSMSHLLLVDSLHAVRYPCVASLGRYVGVNPLHLEEKLDSEKRGE